MHETDDMDLVREYASGHSEQAFATLVGRHINLVYSVSLRRLGNSHHAEEVTQAVFIILARKAGSLRPGTILSGWLYQTAQLTSANFQRAEFRRQRREQEAHMQFVEESDPDVSWQRLAPLLEDAMAQLGEKERNAVVLRFFENRTVREVATALDVQEDAAQKRVNRATEKLRNFFIKRGIKISAGILAGAIGANSIQAAPKALTSTVVATAAAKGAAVSASTLTLIKTTLKLMAWTKIKTTAVIGAALLLTAGTTLVTVKAVKAVQASRQNAALVAIRGDWEGTVAMKGIKTRIVVKIAKVNGSYRATLDSIDQNAKDIPISKIVYDKPNVRMEMPSIDIVMQATVDPATTEMAGTFTQMGLTTPLSLKRTTEPSTVPEKLAANEYAPRTDSDLQGLWKGTLKVKGISLRLNFKLAEQADGKFHGEVDSLDQGVKGLLVSDMTYKKPDVRIEMSGIGSVFEGKVNSSNTEISGTWTQMGTQFPLTITRSDAGAEQAAEATLSFDPANDSDLQGHWKGTLQIQKTKLRLVLHIGKQADGTFATTMDSPDQGAKDMLASTTRYAAPKVHMEWKAIRGVFEGNLKSGKLSGTWRQGAASLPLALERSATK
jgi:RNA polymerase sigma factor (sigma-70 family)